MFGLPCTRPITAYRAEGGHVTLNPSEGWRDRPFTIPCGKCIACLEARARAWGVRCMHEFQVPANGLAPGVGAFITLTYSNENLPRDGSLHVEHLQKFWKRLRKRVGKFRYFACGEYSVVARPHYHAILFGQSFLDDRIFYKADGCLKNKMYLSPTLEESWGYGFAPFGEVTYESCRYVARYVMKKYDAGRDGSAYERTDKDTGETFRVKPPFVTMSRRPGIGQAWLDKYKGDVYPHDQVVLEGRKFRPPRYYDQQLEEDELQGLRTERIRKALKRAGEYTPDRLKTYEKVDEAKVKMFSRE